MQLSKSYPRPCRRAISVNWQAAHRRADQARQGRRGDQARCRRLAGHQDRSTHRDRHSVCVWCPGRCQEGCGRSEGGSMTGRRFTVVRRGTALGNDGGKARHELGASSPVTIRPTVTCTVMPAARPPPLTNRPTTMTMTIRGAWGDRPHRFSHCPADSSWWTMLPQSVDRSPTRSVNQSTDHSGGRSCPARPPVPVYRLRAVSGIVRGRELRYGSAMRSVYVRAGGR